MNVEFSSRHEVCPIWKLRISDGKFQCSIESILALGIRVGRLSGKVRVVLHVGGCAEFNSAPMQGNIVNVMMMMMMILMRST